MTPWLTLLLAIAIAIVLVRLAWRFLGFVVRCIEAPFAWCWRHLTGAGR